MIDFYTGIFYLRMIYYIHMNELLHADIFFFITSIAVILVTAFVVVALGHIIAILRNIRKITEVVRKSSELLGDRVVNSAIGIVSDTIKRFLGMTIPVSGTKKTTRKKK